MAAAKGGVNFIKYYFYEGNTITAARKSALVSLAYATARDQQQAPKAILIRADIHNTTTIDGMHTEDPKGWHGTFAFKTDTQDSTPRGGKKSGKVVWPDEHLLEEYKGNPIGYSHLPEQN
ncbi:hypothetical protein L228DRAFT_282907 [Xylona heveae TC161]|uniref:Uncharacterized protein n=1 Tax=Xylona heveae (strain CBS 132557 / TC161) TaxID=1328760 RepID=A0A165H0A8_XYLHT|nr:hypothetical protein L228DRAFT_282907 [Xylona heveae TC161]KZF22826.1 hypothetical protein L228DRAFT_282907 [Xylona heveae TC161]